jgi:hypothetical protein
MADFAMCPLGPADLALFRSAWTMLNRPRGLTDDDILGGEPLEDQMADQSRLDFLEGRVEEQSRNWERLFAEFGRVDQKISRLDQKIDAFGMGVSTRMDTIYGALDQKLDRKIDALRTEQATQFRWTIGIMTALITGVLAAILTG